MLSFILAADVCNPLTAYALEGNEKSVEIESEETMAGPEYGWLEQNGKSYWYENDTRQGTSSDPKGVLGDGTVRGREIYDPESNGWYWLDACYDGAKAESKEVWIPYIYQEEADWDAEMISKAADLSRAMKEQVRTAIENRTGKWVRYDETGKMCKGWYTVPSDSELYPNQRGNHYYYDPKTGMMAKGTVEILGKTYHFDEVTGALISKDKELLLVRKTDSSTQNIYTYEYDFRGNLVACTPSYGYDSVKIYYDNLGHKSEYNQGHYRKIWEYDEQDRIVKSMETDRPDECYREYRYTYDNQGLLQEERWENHWEDTLFIKYDDRGREVEHICHDSDEEQGDRSEDYRYTISYEMEGNKELRKVRNEAGEQVWMYINEYTVCNSEGQIVEKVEKDREERERQWFSSRTYDMEWGYHYIYTYDANGNVTGETKSCISEMNGYEVVKETLSFVVAYNYDDKGNIVSEAIQYYDDKGELDYTIVKLYNEGHLVREDEYSVEGEFLESTVYEYAEM